MPRRSSPTPLYEVMVGRRDPRSRLPPRKEVVADKAAGIDGITDVEGDRRSLLSGRSVRVPMGYLFLAGGLGIIVLIGVYAIGSQRGEETARAEYEAYWTGGGGSASPPVGAARDPLLIQPARAETTPGGGDVRPSAAIDASGGDRRQGWGPIESDPRRSGFHYLVLVETRPEGAERLVEFCRERGVEAYAVRGHNARFRRVIVLPGFRTVAASNPDLIRLREAVLRIGQAWKATYPRESDLRDAYLSAADKTG